MKKIKKIVSLLLAMTMVLSMGLSVSAANTTEHTIKIKYEKENHTYEAYQIFVGDISDGKLTNIDWGNGIDSTNFLTELKSGENSKFAACSTAADVADVLVGFKDDSDELEAFARVAASHLTGTYSESKETKAPYTITVTGDGYYFVKDKDKSVDAESDAYTKYILRVVGDVEIDAKAEAPTLDKKIVDGTDKVTENDAAIGNIIDFEVTSSMPDLDGYNKYFFVVKDTLSKGLTFQNDVAVKIGDQLLTENEDYTVTYDDNTQVLEIVFKNFVDRTEPAGTSITITYSAELNEEASIGTSGNKNAVELTYSNNPNVDSKGDPDEPDKPGPEDPTGVTPTKETYTYVTGIQLLKIDGTDNKIKLAGAQFKLEGSNLNKVQISNTEKFVVAEDGEYWKLKSGTYTKTAPTETGGPDDNSDKYDSTKIKYKKGTELSTEFVQTGESVVIEGTTDANGILSFQGLPAGDYTITELVAPNGYNLLTAPIEMTITWTKPVSPATDPTCTWTVTGTKANVNDDGIVEITVENKSGSTLPSTGGTGTTIFYILGSILVIGAGVLLITRKRMSMENN